MDFHTLPRRDLQFLCKNNKIPANITNVAMADALSSLEIVEGLDEYMNQSESNAPRSPTRVAKQPPNTATRTTRRKTAVKAEPKSSSLVPRTCHLTSETDQENVNKNVAQEPKASSVKVEAHVAKTPAVRSTRKASAATSCTSKVQERKKDLPVQSVCNTRKSTRLLEKCMADLSLKTNETLDKLEKNEDTEQKVSAQEKNQSGSEEKSEEAEVIAGRDLSASMEKEWKLLKNDNDQVVGDLEINAGLGNIAVFDANTETTMEKTNEIMGDEKESKNILTQQDKQEETVQAIEAMCEEGPKKNDNDQEKGDLEIYANHGELVVLEYTNTETNNENNEESTKVLAFDGSVQFDQQETEQAIQENAAESEKINKSDEDTLVDQTQVDQPETEQAIQEKHSEAEKANNFDVDTMVDQSEIQLEEDNSGVDSEDIISEADSEPEKINKFEDTLVDQTQVDQAESEHVIQDEDYEPEMIKNFDVDTTVDKFDTKPEEDNSGVDSEDTISEADSNQAVVGSDIAEEDVVLSESEVSAAAPTSPRLLEESKVKTASLSPFAAESISVQFPRPNKTTTPLKKSAMKLLVNVDKENDKEFMMNININDNGESKGDNKTKKKKVEIDEESLKEVSIRQLVKMVKELSIKNSNRTALQILPANNNQIAE